MEEVIEKILAVREQLEKLVIPANDQNMLIVYGSRQILQETANMLAERLKAEQKTVQTGSADAKE